MLNRTFFYFCVFILLQGCSSHMPKLGVSNGKLAACPSSPNCVSSQAAVGDKHYIEPIVLKASMASAHDKVMSVLESSRRTKVVVNEENYIHAEFTSAVFRFVDDVEFLFAKERDGEVMVDIRSASRVGHSDFGVNRKRMEDIRGKLEE